MSNLLIRKWFVDSSVHVQDIIRGAASAFVLKIFAAGVAFLYNVLLARYLGAQGTGIYFLSFTIVFIGATIARFGLDNTIVRYLSISKAKQEYAMLHGIYRKAVILTASLSLVITLIIVMSSSWLSTNFFNNQDLVRPLQIMALSIMPVALFTLHASALQGLKHIKEYITVLSLWSPLIAAGGVLLLVPTYGVEGAVVAFLVGATVTLVISYIQWKRAVSAYKVKAEVFNTETMLQSCVPLFFSSVLRIIIERSSVVLLGLWVMSEDIGVFSVAYRLAMLTSFILVAVNSVSAPVFASLYEQEKMSELKQTARITAKILMLIATPVLVIFVGFPEAMMSIFGAEFIQGANILVILAIGQYVNLITGSVGYLLIMSGYEKLMRNNLFFSAGLCLILNIVLIPNYGIVGAALATSITVATQNLIATYLVRQKLGFLIIPIPGTANKGV